MLSTLFGISETIEWFLYTISILLRLSGVLWTKKSPIRVNPVSSWRKVTVSTVEAADANVPDGRAVIARKMNIRLLLNFENPFRECKKLRTI